MSREEQEIYRDIVLWCAENAPDKWNKVHINIEMKTDGEEVANSWIMRWYKGILNKSFQFDIPASQKVLMRNLFVELNDRFGGRWTVCDFILTSKGKYDVSFSYEEPPRLSGDLRHGA